jgi:hypothetical protein
MKKTEPIEEFVERKKTIDEKAMEAVLKFSQSSLTKFETFPEIDGVYYKISISKLSKSQIKKLKEDYYI